MTTNTEPQSIPAETRKTGSLGKTIRWAVRITSIPVFGLLLIPLVPALANFAVGARDDRIMAVGLCATALGFALGWRWAGIGGLITVLGVGAVVSQEEGGLAADPFSVAFGLQGVLFLISAVLNSSAGQCAPTPPRGIWFKRAAAGVLVLSATAGAVIIWQGPPPTPLPKEKESYVGTWDNKEGLHLEIMGEGKVRITQDKEAKVAPCNTPVGPGNSGEFQVEFHDDRLELSGGLLRDLKVYHIDRRPIVRGKQVTMVLNGSDPYTRTNGMLLVKRLGTEKKPSKPDTKAGK
jgi:hypothetical protein